MYFNVVHISNRSALFIPFGLGLGRGPAPVWLSAPGRLHRAAVNEKLGAEWRKVLWMSASTSGLLTSDSILEWSTLRESFRCNAAMPQVLLWIWIHRRGGGKDPELQRKQTAWICLYLSIYLSIYLYLYIYIYIYSTYTYTYTYTYTSTYTDTHTHIRTYTHDTHDTHDT